MYRPVQVSTLAVAAIVVGIAVFGFRCPRPVPGVSGSMRVSVSDTPSADRRFLSDVGGSPDGPGAIAGHLVEVRVAWHLAATPPQGCWVTVVILPHDYDATLALQGAGAQGRLAMTTPTAMGVMAEAGPSFVRSEIGVASLSHARVVGGSDPAVTAALRNAGVPSERTFSTPADGRDGVIVSVYSAASPAGTAVDRHRFQGWTVLRCADADADADADGADGEGDDASRLSPVAALALTES